jgi:structure-specific recognition protein 1
VDFARTGGASSTFDLHVFMKDGSFHEFSNISRHELTAMEDWAKAVNLPVGSPLSGDEGTCNEESEMEMDEEDDEDDDDFNPYDDSKRQRSEDEEDDSSDEDNVELVSEEDFKIETLMKMIEDDAEGEK